MNGKWIIRSVCINRLQTGYISYRRVTPGGNSQLLWQKENIKEKSLAIFKDDDFAGKAGM
jgi:hypothetical protein